VRITSKELLALASDVDAQHHDSMRTFREEAGELHLGASHGSRRTFMRKAGVAGAGGALLTTGLLPFNKLLAAGAQSGGLSDTVIAGYAQSVELAAVAAYTAAAPALTDAPLAVASMFLDHHQQHADAFGSVAGDDARPEANPALVALVTPTLTTVGDAVKDGQAGSEGLTMAVLEFARVLENQAAYTYAAALTLLQNAEFAKATSTILPIEAQHAAVLAIALGKGPEEIFPTGAFESAALGDGTDPLKGLDPATFA
jgi:hypothetical protein